MNDRSDHKKLLDDVLAESSPPDFRAALLGETLRLARSRRRRRQARRSAGVLAALLFAVWFAWQNRPMQRTVAVRPAAPTWAAKSYTLVETQPFSAKAILTTKDFVGAKLIASTTRVEAITTRGGGFRFINDAQLLALAGPRPAMLIRTGPNAEELVFADSAAPPAPPKGGAAN